VPDIDDGTVFIAAPRPMTGAVLRTLRELRVCRAPGTHRTLPAWRAEGLAWVTANGRRLRLIGDRRRPAEAFSGGMRLGLESDVTKSARAAPSRARRALCYLTSERSRQHPGKVPERLAYQVSANP